MLVLRESVLGQRGGFRAAGQHPNPRKAAEGYRLRVLTLDEPAAEVVRRIFAAYLEVKGDRPEQNRHRLADGWHGWQGSTVRAIVDTRVG